MTRSLIPIYSRYSRPGRPSPLKVINTLTELKGLKYLGRKAKTLDSKAILLDRLNMGKQTYFIKPAKTPKLFAATTTCYMDEVPAHEPLFVSELLQDIVAEWRIFVLRGHILSIRPYMLQNWVCPDRSLVEEMAGKVTLPSCTIDVAVLASGRTVLLEVHPFISCGLYGFDGPDILRMASVAWNHQIQML